MKWFLHNCNDRTNSAYLVGVMNIAKYFNVGDSRSNQLKAVHPSIHFRTLFFPLWDVGELEPVVTAKEAWKK